MKLCRVGDAGRFWRDDGPLRSRPSGKFKGSARALILMTGLDPAIHGFLAADTWMPGTSPGMTMVEAYAAAFGKR
jgi:hypothetical protein